MLANIAALVGGDAQTRNATLRSIFQRLPNPNRLEPEVLQNRLGAVGSVGIAGRSDQSIGVVELSDPGDRDGSLVAVDGWIANFADVAIALGLHRPTLAALIATGYARWDVDFFSRVDGDFSIIIVLARSGELVLARSPLGARPLHWRQDGDGATYAASLANCLIPPSDDVSDRIDPLALWREALGLSLVAPSTCFKDVFAVAAGSGVVVGTRGVRSFRHYSPSGARARELSETEAVTEYRGALDASILAVGQHRGREIGLALSGGLDSAVVAGGISQHRSLALRVSCGTGILEGPAGEDATWATKVAAACGMDHWTFPGGAFELPDSIIRYASNPFSAARLGFGLEMFSKFKERGVDFLVTGAMGDIVGGASRSGGERVLRAPLSYFHRLRGEPTVSVAARALFNLAVALGRLGAVKSHSRSLMVLVHPNFRRFLRDRRALICADMDTLATLETEFWDTFVRSDYAQEDSEFRYRLVLDRAVENELVNWDFAGRCTGVEVVHPLATKQLFDLASGLRMGLRRRGGTTRIAMRLASADWLPPDVTWRTTKLHLSHHFRSQWERQIRAAGEDRFGCLADWFKCSILNSYCARIESVPHTLVRTCYQAMVANRWLQLNQTP